MKEIKVERETVRKSASKKKDKKDPDWVIKKYGDQEKYDSEKKQPPTT